MSQLYFTKYFGPTNHKGSRIRVQDNFNGKVRFISYDYSARCPHQSAANEFAGLTVEKLGQTPDGCGFVFRALL